MKQQTYNGHIIQVRSVVVFQQDYVEALRRMFFPSLCLQYWQVFSHGSSLVEIEPANENDAIAILSAHSEYELYLLSDILGCLSSGGFKTTRYSWELRGTAPARQAGRL